MITYRKASTKVGFFLPNTQLNQWFGRTSQTIFFDRFSYSSVRISYILTTILTSKSA